MSVYDMVNKIITDKLKEGVVPWKKLWTTKQGLLPMSLTTGKVYNGINRLILSCVAMEYDNSPYFLTYKQAVARGGCIRKGEKGFPIFFFKMLEPKKSKDEKEKDDKPTFVLQYYKVFNLEQCDNVTLTDKEQIVMNSKLLQLSDHIPLERAESMLSGYSEMPDISIDTSYNPIYISSEDLIKLPPKGQFETVEEFYSTWFHELIHSTGHSSRLDRLSDYKKQDFKPVEELTAEIGSTYLSHDAGIISDVVDNNAAYIDFWLKQIEGNSRLFTTATARAEKAYKYVLDHSIESGKSNLKVS